MADTGIKPEVIEEIRELAKKYDVKRVILFGSRARGDYKRCSDIDLNGSAQEELLESIEKEGKLLFSPRHSQKHTYVRSATSQLFCS